MKEYIRLDDPDVAPISSLKLEKKTTATELSSPRTLLSKVLEREEKEKENKPNSPRKSSKNKGSASLIYVSTNTGVQSVYAPPRDKPKRKGSTPTIFGLNRKSSVDSD
eukprot:TRINITY_DN3374_c0_g1_i1.p1 TRINITY_DN3374_c0_g1~~TRINITY_DN3374_c0_g1_i1.p1  ORF type:complete len:108 (+),score=19.99 TRINITY_DN3374_c0_g1_i1:96-419(+)